MGEPFQVMAAGCGGYVHQVVTGPSTCGSEPTVVGLLMYRRSDGRRAVWRGFACDAHADQLLAARGLLPRDRDVLGTATGETAGADRWARRWAGEQEGPLARGAEADRLLARALSWTAAHPR